MINIWKTDNAAVHDGPGIRTSLYLKGCPLRCIWCSNPEGQKPEPDLVFIESRCIGCGLCVEKCASGALELRKAADTQKAGLRVNRSGCGLCGECVLACPSKALEIWGRRYTIDEAVKLVEKNRPLYRKSGGGVTLTGGDPLYQGESTAELLEQCRKWGIHTAVETSGFCGEDAFERVLGSVDLLFVDLKHMDPDEHMKLTGKRNEVIIRNLRRASSVLGRRNRDLVVRMVVVPGINDGDNIGRAGELLRALPYIKEVELLPYHRYGMAKYELLSRAYRLPGLEPASDDLMGHCRDLMRSCGLEAR